MKRPRTRLMIESVTRSVVAVGDGRGFIVPGWFSPLVITAAHCLPHLPPAHGMSYTEERTYPKLLGPIGGERTVFAECLFVDPVGDIAVLCEPDYEVLSDECDAYRELTEERTPLAVADIREGGHRAWMLSLEGRWFSCRVKYHRGPLGIMELAEPIPAGMSGSPIVADDGSAIGVVCLNAGGDDRAGVIIGSSPQPRLADALPRGLWKQMTRPRRFTGEEREPKS